MSFIASYLLKAKDMRASDIHICEGSPVRARVDGEILVLDNTPPPIDYIFKELLDTNPEYLRKKLEQDFENLNDISFSFDSPHHDLRLRVTIYRDQKGICVAIRLISATVLTHGDLGLPNALLDVCHTNRGLFIVTGSSGSGKSTTLAAMISYINSTMKSHIITLEDPIEYVIKPDKCMINYREVGIHTTSFQAGLNWILREDPNIVVIGEMRDRESMRAAITIAETGHLVLTTLHTRNSISAIDRLIGSFPPDDQQQFRMMLADNLIGVLAQTLIPKRGGGRVAAFELLLNNDAIKNNIREHKIYQIDNVLQTGQRNGMIPMEDYIIDLLKRDIIEYDMAMKYAPSRAKLKDKCNVAFGKKI